MTPATRDFYEFDSRITRRCIERKRSKWYDVLSQLNTIIEFRRAFNEIKPDYIISFLPKTNILTLTATLGTPFRVVVCERNIINDPDIDKRQHWLRKILYKRAYKITVQHEEIYDEFVHTYPAIPSDHIVITPNPVNVFTYKEAADPSVLFPDFLKGDPLLIGIGRFTATKAFKDLIEVLSFVSKEKSNARLVIFGDGSEHEECKALVKELGLERQVSLPGPTDRINDWFAVSDIFLTTTKYEGFPNALSEALSAGLPAIAFRAPSISVLVKHGENGFLVENRDKSAMAEKIIMFLNDPELKHKFSTEARKISEKYSFEKMNSIWFDEVLC